MTSPAALLASRLFARAFAQTAHPRRLVQPVTRWRLAAVAAVQPETALQLDDTGVQNRNLRRLRGGEAVARTRLNSDSTQTGLTRVLAASPAASGRSWLRIVAAHFAHEAD